MAHPLETQIMCEIGLGPHYNQSNGSGSCEYLRNQAARQLPEVLKKYHDEGKEVAKPDSNLCYLLERVARGEGSQYELTKTWQAASYVIQAHMYLYHAKSHDEHNKILENFVSTISRL